MNELQNIIKYEDLVYDVGMHKGEDTDYYLKKGFRVIGVEADPDLAEQCRQRFANEIKTGRLIVVEGAITEPSSGETIKFYKNKNRSVWGTVVNDWANRNEFLRTTNEIIEVSAVDFSECLKKCGIPHYLKIDIEGMDTVCLKALKNFKQKPDYVSIESEKLSFDKLLEELDLLIRLGYSRFKAIPQKGISNQIEPIPSKEGHYASYRFQEGSSGLFGADLPDEWKGYKQILNEYKFIFLQYRILGDYGKLGKHNFIGKLLRKTLRVISGKPIPGWYDTHAKHSSVAS